jgi:hypothetical protein
MRRDLPGDRAIAWKNKIPKRMLRKKNPTTYWQRVGNKEEGYHKTHRKLTSL